MGASAVRSRPRFKESGGGGGIKRLCVQSWVTGWVGGLLGGGGDEDVM